MTRSSTCRRAGCLRHRVSNAWRAGSVSDRSFQRAGFTLVELLVVIAILTILAGLVIGAAMRVIGTMALKDTQNLVAKLGVALNQQMQAVVDQANREPIPEPYHSNIRNNLAGGDEQLTRVIWIKLRLIQQFPESVSDATSPAGGTYIAPDPYFTTALNGVSPGSNPPYLENSLCLALALSNSSRGSVFSLDNLAAREKALVPGTNLVYIRDAFTSDVPTGNPIMFTKFLGYSNADLNPNVVPNKGVQGPPFLDPFDPAGKLSGQGWTNSSQFQTVFGCNNKPLPLYPTPVAGYSYNLQPFVFSTGGPANGPGVTSTNPLWSWPPSYWYGSGNVGNAQPGWIYSYRSKAGGYQ